MDEVDTLLDNSFKDATLEVLSHINIRGVDASRKIDQRKEFLEERGGLTGESGITSNSSASGQSIESTFPSSSQSSPLLPSPSHEAVVDLAQLVLVGATLPVRFQDILNRVVDTDSLHRLSTPHLHRLAPHVNHKFFRVQPSTKTGIVCPLIKRRSTHTHDLARARTPTESQHTLTYSYILTLSHATAD